MKLDLYQEPEEQRAADFAKQTCDQPEIRCRFQYGELDSGSFPGKLWRMYTADMLDEPQAQGVHCYYDVRGDEQLRQESRRYLYRNRGVHCESEQVVLCSGTQLALEIIIRLFQVSTQLPWRNRAMTGHVPHFRAMAFKYLPYPLGKRNRPALAVRCTRLDGIYRPLPPISHRGCDAYPKPDGAAEAGP